MGAVVTVHAVTPVVPLNQAAVQSFAHQNADCSASSEALHVALKFADATLVVLRQVAAAMPDPSGLVTSVVVRVSHHAA